MHPDFAQAEKPFTLVGMDVKPPKTTFFYQQPNDRIIVVEEQEAYYIHKKFKQVGVSDGNVYHAALIEAQKVAKTGDLLKAQEILRKGQDDELAVARGHFQLPRDFSRTNAANQPIAPGGNPLPPNPRT